METDIIGGFPVAEPNCKGCGKPLTLENASLTDGCPCNSPLGVNSMNETRWRLLMERLAEAEREREYTKRTITTTVHVQSHSRKGRTNEEQ